VGNEILAVVRYDKKVQDFFLQIILSIIYKNNYMENKHSFEITEMRYNLYTMNYNYYMSKKLNQHNFTYSTRFKLKRYFELYAEYISETSNMKDINYKIAMKEIKRINRRVLRDVKKRLDVIPFKQI
jgi:hypothetical protein